MHSISKHVFRGVLLTDYTSKRCKSAHTSSQDAANRAPLPRRAALRS